MSNITLIYHRDPDGFCSAAIASHELLKRVPRPHIEYRDINYGEPLPKITAAEDDEVYMLDFAYQPIEEMLALHSSLDERLVWIDHHKSSLDYEAEEPSLRKVRGIRKLLAPGMTTVISACELTWDYFHSHKDPYPRAVVLIGNWDTWRWKLNNDLSAKIFMNGLQGYNTNPNTLGGREFWTSLLFSNTTKMIEEVFDRGSILSKYRARLDKAKMKSAAFEGTFSGISALMVNSLGNSETFAEAYDPDKHVLMVGFQFTKGKYWTISLYSEKEFIHCGDLAKSLGASQSNTASRGSGGGHKGAAGFQTSYNHLENLISILDL